MSRLKELEIKIIFGRLLSRLFLVGLVILCGMTYFSLERNCITYYINHTACGEALGEFRTRQGEIMEEIINMGPPLTTGFSTWKATTDHILVCFNNASIIPCVKSRSRLYVDEHEYLNECFVERKTNNFILRFAP